MPMVLPTLKQRQRQVSSSLSARAVTPRAAMGARGKGRRSTSLVMRNIT